MENLSTNLLISGFGPWRHEARDTILKSLCKPYYADPTPTCGASCDVFDLCSFLPVEIRKTSTALFTVRKLNCIFNGRILNYCLFKIFKLSGPSLLGTTSSTLQSHFLSWCLFWQMVIVISFPRGRKTAPNDYAPGLRDPSGSKPTSPQRFNAGYSFSTFNFGVNLSKKVGCLDCVLWHVKHFWLFKDKSCFYKYIKYIICKHIL